jgi:hypothetical protein
MRATFTPKALAKAREEIAALDDPRAVVMIFLGVPQAALRESNGKVVPIKRARIGWRAWCLPLGEWPMELERAEVSGIPVVLLTSTVSDSPRTFRIAVKRGELHVALAA